MTPNRILWFPLGLALATAGCADETSTPTSWPDPDQPVAAALSTTDGAVDELPPWCDPGPPVSTVGDWKRIVVPNAVARGAVCNDGCPYVYYVRPGQGDDANNWLIFLKGGGYCATIEECTRRQQYQTGLMQPKPKWWSPDTGMERPERQCGKYPETSNPRGLLWGNPELNPFGGWTTVFMPYCSSDVWYGDTDADDANSIPWAFKGSRIVTAVMEDLIQRSTKHERSIASAERVLFSGGSAGAAGVAHNVDRVAAMLPDVQVLALSDGDLVPTVTPREGQGGGGAIWQGVADESCLEAWPDRPRYCHRVSHVMMHHVETPMFVFMDQYDMNFLKSAGMTDLCISAECVDDSDCGDGASCRRGACIGPVCNGDTSGCFDGTFFGDACPEGDPVCGAGACYHAVGCFGAACASDDDCSGADVCRQGFCAQANRSYCDDDNPCGGDHRCLKIKRTPWAQAFAAGVRDMSEAFSGVYISQTGTHTAGKSCKFYELRVRGKRYVDTLANWVFRLDGPRRVVAPPGTRFP